MRTFDRDTYLRAQREWADGEFGWRWYAIRRIAADRGFILPPHGTVHDDRDADPPSQRAIIFRALEDNPTNVEGIVRRSRSWADVVDGIIGLEKRLAEDADDLARDTAWSRKDEPTGRQAAMSIRDIFQRILDS